MYQHLKTTSHKTTWLSVSTVRNLYSQNGNTIITNTLPVMSLHILQVLFSWNHIYWPVVYLPLRPPRHRLQIACKPLFLSSWRLDFLLDFLQHAQDNQYRLKQSGRYPLNLPVSPRFSASCRRHQGHTVPLPRSRSPIPDNATIPRYRILCTVGSERRVTARSRHQCLSAYILHT